MASERWQRIEELYHEARDRTKEERSAFLAVACGGDDALCAEVVALLEADARSGGILDDVVVNLVPPQGDRQSLVGRTIGAYDVFGWIGSGGVGDVYRGRDPRLGRDVAIKVLRAELAADADRMARFKREAQLLAALNNPHIAQIYDLEQFDQSFAIVMELIEGPTLADRLKQGAVPSAEALPIALEIASALEAAHEQGIVHRDLKPSNITVRPDGRVKVLDFGLAKAVRSESASDLTYEGGILGTVAYMSPEQATGKPVDRRTDLWSFGVVLMEMLTGSPTFAGETTTDVIASVLRTEPQWSKLPDDTPSPIRRLLRRCLQKDRSDRLGDASTARLEIQDAMVGTHESLPATSSSWLRSRYAGLWALAAVAVLALATTLALRHDASGPDAASDALPVQFTIPAPEKIVIGYTTLSPDGRQVAFVGGDDSGHTSLWVRKLDSLTSQAVGGTDGAGLSFWSPDSRSIAFFVGRQLKRMRVDQGVPELVADFGDFGVPGDGAAWASDGTLLLSLNLDGLYRVRPGSRTVEKFTALDPARKETRHYSPSMLPDGAHFLLTVTSGLPDVQGVWVVSLENPADRHRVLPDVSKAEYSMGHLLFVREKNLVAQPFDMETLTVTGEAVSIVSNTPVSTASGYADFSTSNNGVLSVGGAAAPMRMTVFDRAGKPVQPFGPVLQRYQAVRIAPNQRLVAADAQHETGYQIFVFDPARDTSTQLTFGKSTGNFPVWSPDSNQIAFGSNREGVYDMFIKASGGSSRDEVLLQTMRNKFVMDWSRDGKYLLYGEDESSPRKERLWLLPMTGDRKPVLYLDDKFDTREARFSPDGKWVAYTSLEPASRQVYVRSFPDPSTKIQISGESGSRPVWRDDGKELFYVTRGGQLMVVSINPGSPLDVGPPTPLFQTDLFNTLITFDVYQGGQRFVMPANEQQTTSLQVILNWPALAARLR